MKGKAKPRVILVNTETKVISQMMDDKQTLVAFKESNTVVSQYGIVSNWVLDNSNSYKEYIIIKRKRSSSSIVNSKDLRNVAEQLDYFLGTLLSHSIAGGTGSDLGSRLMKDFRNEYKKCYHMTISILSRL